MTFQLVTLHELPPAATPLVFDADMMKAGRYHAYNFSRSSIRAVTASGESTLADELSITHFTQ